MGTQLSLPKKGTEPPSPILGPCLLCPNSWMDQDATWYGGRPRSKRHCVRWGPSSPSPKRAQNPLILGPCLLWPNSCMDQDATWCGGRLCPGHIVLDGNPAHPRQKGGTAPNFWPMCVVVKRLDGSRCQFV